MEQILSKSDMKMKPGCFLRRVMTRDSRADKFVPMPGEIGSRRKDKNLGTSGSGNRYRRGGAAGAVKWIRSLAEEGKAAERTERLLSPQP